MKFSNSDKVDMLLIYGACGKNATRASIMHAEKYPERNQPFRWTFQRLCTSLSETGNFNVIRRKRTKRVTTEENTVAVLAAVTHNSHISTREIAL